MADKIRDIFEQQKMDASGLGRGIGEAQDDPEDILQVIGFVVGNEEFAVPILNVKEIVKPTEFTRVPGTPPYVLGVFNMRGNVYPLINLRLKFGLPAIKQDKDTRYLIVHQNDEIAGFVIDKLTAAITLPSSSIDPVPETLASNQAGMIDGVGKREDHLITILKIDMLLKRDF